MMSKLDTMTDADLENLENTLGKYITDNRRLKKENHEFAHALRRIALSVITAGREMEKIMEALKERKDDEPVSGDGK